jgi:hypothetical protein
MLHRGLSGVGNVALCAVGIFQNLYQGWRSTRAARRAGEGVTGGVGVGESGEGRVGVKGDEG